MIREAAVDLLSRFRRVGPTSLALLVTGRCNARCVMCAIWREGIPGGPELSLDEWRGLFADPLLRGVTSAVLSGGEAVLREDIVDLSVALAEGLPRLRRLTLATNGLNPPLVTRQVAATASRLAFLRRPPRLTVQVSFDGVSEVHDKIRGRGALRLVARTLDGLEDLRRAHPGLGVSAGCVLQPLNLAEAEAMREHLGARGIPSIFTVVCREEHYYRNDESDGLDFSPGEREGARRFMLDLSRRHPDIGMRFLYRGFADMLGGAPNRRGCPALRTTLTVEPHGDVVPCLNGGGLVLGNVRERSPGDLWRSPATREALEEVRASRCPGCMFACGVGHLEAARFAAATLWRRR